MLRKNEHIVMYIEGKYWGYVCIRNNGRDWTTAPVRCYPDKEAAEKAVAAANELFWEEFNRYQAHLDEEKRDATHTAGTSKTKKEPVVANDYNFD